MTAPARTYTPSSTTSVVVSLPGSSRSGWNHKPRARFSLRRRRTSRRTARPPPSWPTRAWRTSTARSTISSASANCAAYLPRSKSASRKPGPMHGLCSLKHGWLYLHQLDTFAALERLVAFYVEQHNTVLPHAAFAGQKSRNGPARIWSKQSLTPRAVPRRCATGRSGNSIRKGWR